MASQNRVSCHKIQALAGTYPSGFLFIFCLLISFVLVKANSRLPNIHCSLGEEDQEHSFAGPSVGGWRGGSHSGAACGGSTTSGRPPAPAWQPSSGACSVSPGVLGRGGQTLGSTRVCPAPTAKPFFCFPAPTHRRAQASFLASVWRGPCLGGRAGPSLPARHGGLGTAAFCSAGAAVSVGANGWWARHQHRRPYVGHSLGSLVGASKLHRGGPWAAICHHKEAGVSQCVHGQQCDPWGPIGGLGKRPKVEGRACQGEDVGLCGTPHKGE